MKLYVSKSIHETDDGWKDHFKIIVVGYASTEIPDRESRARLLTLFGLPPAMTFTMADLFLFLKGEHVSLVNRSFRETQHLLRCDVSVYIYDIEIVPQLLR